MVCSDSPIDRPTSTTAIPQTQPVPSGFEPPLFEPSSPSIEPGSPITIAQDEAVTEQWSPPSSPPPLSNNTPHDRQLQAQEEIRQHFHWLPNLIEKNRDAGWGTGYRDFVDVLYLLYAVRELGMIEGPNSLSLGKFQATTGEFILDAVTFIDIMQLNHAPGTWRNKFTVYFRLKALQLHSEYAGGVMFQTPGYQFVWETVLSKWTRNQERVLPVNLVTTRFGITELRPLVKDMVAEAKQSKCPILPPVTFGTDHANF